MNTSDSVTVAAVIPAYSCPSLRAPTLYTNSSNTPNTAAYMNDYAGCNGTTTIANNPSPTGPNGNGCIVGNPNTIMFAHITDGTSNTLLIGEKAINLAYLAGGDAGDDTGYQCGFGWDTLRTGVGVPLHNVTQAGTRGVVSDFFGSAHFTGMNAAFADGTVRNIPYSISLPTFQSLCQINDGNAVSLDF